MEENNNELINYEAYGKSKRFRLVKIVALPGVVFLGMSLIVMAGKDKQLKPMIPLLFYSGLGITGLAYILHQTGKRKYERELTQ